MGSNKINNINSWLTCQGSHTGQLGSSGGICCSLQSSEFMFLVIILALLSYSLRYAVLNLYYEMWHWFNPQWGKNFWLVYGISGNPAL